MFHFWRFDARQPILQNHVCIFLSSFQIESELSELLRIRPNASELIFWGDRWRSQQLTEWQSCQNYSERESFVSKPSQGRFCYRISWKWSLLNLLFWIELNPYCIWAVSDSWLATKHTKKKALLISLRRTLLRSGGKWPDSEAFDFRTAVPSQSTQHSLYWLRDTRNKTRKCQKRRSRPIDRPCVMSILM